MRSKYLLLFMICLLFLHKGMAQQQQMMHWSVNEGLAGSTVYCTLQDRQGFMWFGTDQGLCRFDGTNFKIYTVADGLSDNDVFWIVEDSKGRLWMICYNSIPCYMEDGVIHRFWAEPKIKESARIEFPSAILNAPGDNLYLLTSQGLYTIDTALRIVKKNSFPDAPLGMTFTKNEIFVAVLSSIVKISGDKVTKLHDVENNWNLYQGLKIDGNKLLYARYNPHISQLISIDKNTGGEMKLLFETKHSILNFDFLSDTTIQILTTEDGVVIVNTQTGKQTKPYTFKKIPSHLYVDRESNTWVTTLGDGVYLIPQNGVKVYTTQSGLQDNDVLSVCGDHKGRIALGYRKTNVDIMDSTGVIAKLRCTDREKDSRVLTIRELHGDFYMATDYTILKVGKDLRSFVRATDMPIENSKNMSISTRGEILVANTSRAYSFFNTVHVESKELLPQRATSVVEYKDGIYAIGTIRGLFINDHGHAYKFEKDSDLSSARVSDLGTDSRGNLWVSTNSFGVFCINDSGIRNLRERNGLSGKICKKLFIDQSDNVWVCTNRGLNKISLHMDGKIQIRVFDESYGLPTNDVNDVFVSDGEIWVATSQGLARFKEYDLSHQIDASPPLMHILSFTVRDSSYSFLKPMELSYLENDIRLDYAGITFTSGHNIHYKYLLTGTNIVDTVFTTLNSIRFGALPPGAYTLYIWAANKDKVWSISPASVSFKIHPPFWKTIPFYTLLILVILLLSYMTFKMRLNTIQAKEREKVKTNKRISQLEIQALRAQMNPHFVFNALNSIQYYYANNDELTANRYMTTFSALIRQILHSSTQNLISLKDEIALLHNYIELEKMRLKGKFEYELKIDEQIYPERIYLPIMLLQPYVENAITHGLRFGDQGMGLLQISFVLQNDIMICTIDDNGIGVKASMAKKNKSDSTHISEGMQITRQRIDALNTIYNNMIEVTFIDKSDEDEDTTGVRVTIRLPLITQNKA